MKNLIGDRFRHNFVEFFRTNIQIILTLIVFAVISDIFFIKDNSDIKLFFILFVYIFFSKFYALTSKFTFFVSLLVLASMFIEFLLTRASFATEKAAVWLFFFFLIGIIQQLKES